MNMRVSRDRRCGVVLSLLVAQTIKGTVLNRGRDGTARLFGASESSIPSRLGPWRNHVAFRDVQARYLERQHPPSTM
jgi:hypothetical protein